MNEFLLGIVICGGCFAFGVHMGAKWTTRLMAAMVFMDFVKVGHSIDSSHKKAKEVFEGKFDDEVDQARAYFEKVREKHKKGPR